MRGRIDYNDAVVSPFFVVASMVSAGLLSFSLFGYDFAGTLFSLGSGAGAISVSIAKLVAIIALVTAYASNRPDFSDMTSIETWVVVATVGLVLVPPFSPAVESVIQQSQIAGLIAVIVQAGGFYSLAYLG